MSIIDKINVCTPESKNHIQIELKGVMRGKVLKYHLISKCFVFIEKK